MKFTIRDLQARLAALGYHPGPIDGIDGKRTRAAANDAMIDRAVKDVADLFHKSGIHRIHWHWTGGKRGVIDLERKHYNKLIDHDAQRHDGKWSLEDQANYKAGVRGASGTLNANTGAGQYAVDAMHGAEERPFNPGTAPLTWDQIDELTLMTAETCLACDIPVARQSTLSHSEVQPTLGIRQRWKWDINWLPDMDRPGDPIEVGDRLRAMTQDHLDTLKAQVVACSG